jgi:hypothetical protein
MTRRGGGGASSKPSTKPEQPKTAPGNPPVPPVPTLTRGQTFGPGKRPTPAGPIKRENASTKLRIGYTEGGRKRRKTHRKTHRKTRRGY